MRFVEILWILDNINVMMGMSLMEMDVRRGVSKRMDSCVLVVVRQLVISAPLKPQEVHATMVETPLQEQVVTWEQDKTMVQMAVQ